MGAWGTDLQNTGVWGLTAGSHKLRLPRSEIVRLQLTKSGEKYKTK